MIGGEKYIFINVYKSMEFSHPWNFLGKSTGVGCHFLLQGNLPDPGIEPGFPALQAEALPSEPSGNPVYIRYIYKERERER